MLTSCYADLHIHIGRTERGDAVKISGSKDLTFYRIAREASERKGIDIVGVIDCHSPVVQHEIMHYLHAGEMEELAGGGIRYGKTTVILGCELEVREPGMGPAHLLIYMPTLENMQQFTDWLRSRMSNVALSSQRLHAPVRSLQLQVAEMGGLLVPAHIFTPHRSIYGSCSSRMAHLLDLEQVAAVELGLSADSAMALQLSELERFAFLTNSDAHSLGKIAREYNRLRLAAPSFAELALALKGEGGRAIEANYGLNPRLGKYYRTYCSVCDAIVQKDGIVTEACPSCGSGKLVRGVKDRIASIADRPERALPEDRPPYCEQVPLEFIPGLGKRLLDRLLERFGTEMKVLHEASLSELEETAGPAVAAAIVQAREGLLLLENGGGGTYGKVKRHRA